MNRIIILCSGPSLALVDQALAEAKAAGETPQVLAVHRAAVLKPCDVWVCMDIGHAAQGDEPARGVRGLAKDIQGTPRLLTTPDTAGKLKPGEWSADVLKDPDFWSLYDRTRIGWTNFSSTTAVAYAAHLGAQRIDVFGMDLGGTVDADGAENLDVGQFKMQGEILDILAARLKREHNVHVQRHVLPVAEQPAIEASGGTSAPAAKRPRKGK